MTEPMEPRQRSIKRYGWIPDLPDHRDLLFSVSEETLSKLPDEVDLRAQCPPVYDQGQLGSCTANAIAAAFEFMQVKQGLADFTPSRLFIYYIERHIEGTVDQDSGAMIRDGIKTVHRRGVCSETTWPYDISKFTVRPSDAARTEAREHQATTYRRILQNLRQMKGCLAGGIPFVFGFTVYEGFESARVAETGVVHLPRPRESVLGGHAVMAVGYNEESQRFLVRNSWGESWGMSGYFTMPYAYLTDTALANDFWAINAVEA